MPRPVLKTEEGDATARRAADIKRGRDGHLIVTEGLTKTSEAVQDVSRRGYRDVENDYWGGIDKPVRNPGNIRRDYSTLASCICNRAAQIFAYTTQS